MDSKQIILRLKKALNITKDSHLADALNVKPNTISTWKKRDTLDYKTIIILCNSINIDLNEIFREVVDIPVVPMKNQEITNKLEELIALTGKEGETAVQAVLCAVTGARYVGDELMLAEIVDQFCKEVLMPKAKNDMAIRKILMN